MMFMYMIPETVEPTVNDYITSLLQRHPDPSHRPDFRSLLLTLLEHRDSPLTLTLPEGVHPKAGTLGAPLEVGEELYSDLQKTYNNL